ncbi:hypothetical protein NP493_891g00011 [Ridgeia piscesae]|uniref:Uncharacterized protein n=1 Tax=Ridgeia piscesae TaxID=27915 RepID=A0AAD9KLA2_RIDPI|nr:hypothetical protein NP493_891g00011 [Ridgeia piscesae]
MRVVKATRYERPLQGLSVTLGLLKHSGVVVTLTNGRTYLIHKGSQFGTPTGGQTVVVDTRHMDMSRWTPVYSTTKTVSWSKVTDYVKAGGHEYHTLLDNCHGAASRMMRLP